jgi:hypothetical protein
VTWIDPELAAGLDGVPSHLRPTELFDFDDMPGTRARLAGLRRGGLGSATKERAGRDRRARGLGPVGAPELTLRPSAGGRGRSTALRYWIHGAAW